MEINEYLKYIQDSLKLIDKKEVDSLTDALMEAYNNGNMIFVIGNGGSAANASHFAQDLAKGVIPDLDVEKRLKALSLTDNIPFISAVANDNGYDNIFLSQLMTYSKPGDLLIAISGSGNSGNIIKAAEYCKLKSIKVIGVTGYDGGKLKKINDLSVHIELNDMCTVESIHSVIFHYIILALREKIKNERN